MATPIEQHSVNKVNKVQIQYKYNTIQIQYNTFISILGLH